MPGQTMRQTTILGCKHRPDIYHTRWFSHTPTLSHSAEGAFFQKTNAAFQGAHVETWEISPEIHSGEGIVNPVINPGKVFSIDSGQRFSPTPQVLISQVGRRGH